MGENTGGSVSPHTTAISARCLCFCVRPYCRGASSSASRPSASYSAISCECDCSSLVRVCCAYAGITLPASFRTVNEPSNLLKTGRFEEMKGDQFTKQSAYLREGDILCTATSGHTVVVLNNGDKANVEPVIVYEQTNVELSILQKGCVGKEVESVQLLLDGRGYSLGKYGVDGDFGSATEKAVKAFQKDKGVEDDGVVGTDTWTKLIKG